MRNGDIVKAKSSIPLVDHYAIFIKLDDGDHLLHNTPFKGNTISTWSEFFKDRELIYVQDSLISGISKEDLLNRFEAEENDWNLFTHDCEIFIENITGSKSKERQVEELYFVVSMLSLITIYLANKYN